MIPRKERSGTRNMEPRGSTGSTNQEICLDVGNSLSFNEINNRNFPSLRTPSYENGAKYRRISFDTDSRRGCCFPPLATIQRHPFPAEGSHCWPSNLHVDALPDACSRSRDGKEPPPMLIFRAYARRTPSAGVIDTDLHRPTLRPRRLRHRFSS